MFPVKVETRILLNCPHCRFSSRYDTGFLEDAIHDGKEISCVACGCHFEIVVRKVEAAQQSVQRTVDQPCEKHNMEYCSECFPVVVVDFNRR